MSGNRLLAIDLGTTNCKALLLDEHLRIVARVTREYPLSLPRPGWAEQDPRDWWAAVRDSLQCLASQTDLHAIRALGLSGQMHGLVVLDAQGEVLRPAILWNDQRSAPQCRALGERVGGTPGLVSLTNNPMLPGYTGGKLLWVKEHEPEVYRRLRTVLLPKDYLRFRLTGARGTDVSDASGTGLFDVRSRCWSEELLARAELPGEWFPPVHRATDLVGPLLPSVAAELGLPPSTPVIAGGGDAVMQTVGGGATEEGTALIVAGTGGNVTVSTRHPVENTDAALQVFCHVLPDQWTAMGVTLAAGSALRWFREALGGLESVLARELQRDAYDLLCEEAAQSPVGANGVTFLPYLQGERCPHPDPHARGCFLGLGLHTTKADLVRSLLEGVAFSLRDVLARLRHAGLDPQRLHLSGGGAASPLWRQIIADVLGRPATTLDYSEEASAVGAGILAGVATGLWASAAEAAALLPTRTVEAPVTAHVALYDQLFGAYQELYPALAPCFGRRATLSGGET